MTGILALAGLTTVEVGYGLILLSDRLRRRRMISESPIWEMYGGEEQ